MTLALISGALANKPSNGGNAWTRLCWIAGLRRLGFDVLFVEQLSDRVAREPAISFFTRAMEHSSLLHSSALLDAAGSSLCGLPVSEVRRRAREASLLVNISGHLTIAEIKEAPACRVYYDDDPGYTQFWHAAGDAASRLQGHDFYCTLGANIGTVDCPIPTGGIPWKPILPPVSLDDWTPRSPVTFDRFTTIASWRGPYARIKHEGRTFGLKAHEFRKFIKLPRRTGLPFEIALNIHPSDWKDEEALHESGWLLVDPATHAGEPVTYRDYVQRSGAEFSVAQGIYVDTGSGWFSDRTARYLASGRPAVVQDTGFSRHLPTGDGLLAFRSPDEAAECVARVVRDYDTHRRAARGIAEEFFCAERVIGGLLREIGHEVPTS